MTQVNKERMLAEFKEIVALPCHSLQERPVFELLKGKLEALGFTVEEDDAGEKLGGNCGNLWAFCLPAQELKVRYACCFLHIWTVLSPAAALPLSKRTAFYTATAPLFSAVTINPALRVF